MSEQLHLFLHSPPMRGPEVANLQMLLQQKGYYHSKMDGVFDLHMHQAVYRAKYWLGYRTPNHVAGPKLVGFLNGTLKVSVGMKAVAAIRRKLAATRNRPGPKILAEAKKHLGVKESPAGSNRVSFSLWYGMIGSWCAMFVSFCGWVVGLRSTFIKGVRYAYVPFVVDDARRGRNNLVLVHTSQVQPGDLVCYDWPGESPGIADHIGVFEEWITPGVHFHAIEGNTAVGNDSNGGEVMRRDRSVNNVQAFVRVTR